MTKITIIKKQDGYAYKYYMLDEKNKMYYITKSGFKTPQEALEEAKKSYRRRMCYGINSRPVKHKKIALSKNKKEILLKAKDDILSDIKEFGIRNLQITDGGVKLLATATIGVVIVVAGLAGAKLVKDFKNKIESKPQYKMEEEYIAEKRTLVPKDCDFSNLHIILRTAKPTATSVAKTTSNMLNRLGVSNEIIGSNTKLAKTIKNNDKNIVLINLESGFENAKTDNTIIMGDSSNNRKYSSDILSACIKASLKEYNLDTYIRSGKKSNMWREETSIEKELIKEELINKVSQLTIDLPVKVGTDELIKNDVSSSIIEGLMRWASLNPKERYENIYYTAEYGDSIVSVADEYGISLEYIRKYSDVNMHKDVVKGNTILITKLPEVARENVTAYNPCATTDLSKIKQKLNKYIVKKGDTLTKIANENGVKIDEIVVPNKDNTIRVGDIVYIITHDKYETHRKNNTQSFQFQK